MVHELLAEGHGIRTIARHPDSLTDDERSQLKAPLDR